ncbi:HDOD domain-containing protein [Photobacterium lipolyticum]|uniref:Histidine kinase n=1 Tax=Photobacterium lipolyticum TaxID=266810 RepID=A0A2T3MSQ3_9GAMM|nr:HDOD domain-containing protein [Photobacterium lipolyticum]PSW01136.1 histidine kinase [Photobacterium lipolyticum]
MTHLSFFWLKPENEKIIKGLESEFCSLVKDAVRKNRLSLPPIPEVLAQLHTLCNADDTTVRDIADLLLDDPSLAASIVRTSNTIMFNRRNIICHDLQAAVSRLGILRVRDIVTAQAIEELKNKNHFGHECNLLLSQSAIRSRQLAGTMALICQGITKHSDKQLSLEPEKALLTGLLADIGVFGLINEYHSYLNHGNYLDLDIATYVFQQCCGEATSMVLKHWGFDDDYLEVASNKAMPYKEQYNKTSYLDIARMANHLLMFKDNDEAINEHHVELDLAGAEVMYELTNMPDADFESQIRNVMKDSGM